MNRVLIVIVMLLLCGLSQAQLVDWQWASKSVCYYTEYGTSIVTDNSGNSYVTGNFQSNAANPAVFGSTSLFSAGATDIFVAKLDPDGNWLWAIRAGSTSDDNAADLALDANGNIYLTGSFYLTTQIGSTTLTASGSYDVFVAKLSSSGSWLWAKRAGGTGYDAPESIALDSGANCYVSGYFESIASTTASFGSTNLTGAGGYDFFVCKLDAGGNWLWAKRGGGSGGDVSESISVDADGNCYASGYFRGNATFGTTQITSTGTPDVIVVKLDTNGNWLWARSASSSAYGDAKSIVTDSNGNIFVAGYFSLSSTFGTQTLTSAGASDIFAAKLDTDGNWLWAVRGGGTGFDSGENIALDSNGAIHVSGYFNGTAVVGGNTLVSAGARDIFVSRLDSSGNWLWATRAGGTSSDNCYAMAVDNSDNALLIGTFEGTIHFGTLTLVNPSPPGYQDIFVAKLGEIAQPLPPQNVVATIIGNDLLLQWDATVSDTSGQPVIPLHYNVYWREGNSVTYNVVQTTTPGWTHLDGAVNTPRFYYVTAVTAD